MATPGCGGVSRALTSPLLSSRSNSPSQFSAFLRATQSLGNAIPCGIVRLTTTGISCAIKTPCTGQAPWRNDLSLLPPTGPSTCSFRYLDSYVLPDVMPAANKMPAFSTAWVGHAMPCCQTDNSNSGSGGELGCIFMRVRESCSGVSPAVILTDYSWPVSHLSPGYPEAQQCHRLWCCQADNNRGMSSLFGPKVEGSIGSTVLSSCQAVESR